MGAPTIHKADNLKDWDCQMGIEKPDGGRFWVLARPVGYQGLFIIHRIKCAWMVFTGKADVLTWHKEA